MERQNIEHRFLDNRQKLIMKTEFFRENKFPSFGGVRGGRFPVGKLYR